LLKLVEVANSPFEKALISGLFLTGGRVSEVISLDKRFIDLKAHPEVIVVTMPVLKRFKRVARNPDGSWITQRVDEYRTFPIKKSEPLAPYLLRWINRVRGTSVFPVSRSKVFLIVRQVGRILNKPVPYSMIMSNDLYPHWFRAQRACQLKEEYGFDVFALKDFFGWKLKELGTPAVYTKLSWKELARLMGVNV